jgi:hypothetical protein
MKEHFARRLQRLRQEIALRDGLADATRSTLTARLDSVLERWSPLRYATLFLTFVVPAVLYLPALVGKLTQFVESLGFRLPTEYAASLLSQPGAIIALGQLAFGYLIAVPFTAFLAKRGLFLGADRIWFPGWQDGSGAYQKEREIFGSVDIRVHEAPIDLWVFTVLFLIGYGFQLLTSDIQVGWYQSWMGSPPAPGPLAQKIQNIGDIVIAIIWVVSFVGGFVIAVVRRARLGRA